MPNAQNIRRPITMISYGRSGTSLAMNILGNHPDVTACGETASILFATWNGMERARGIIRPDPELPKGVDHDERCAKAVHAVFLASFPETGTPTEHWMHKPIGLPWVLWHLPRMPEFDAKAEWYWRVMHGAFPEGRNITILRHPYDVILSAAEWWNATHRHVWDQLVKLARILTHRDSNVDFALSHARLVADPDVEIARLLDHLGLAHAPECFAAAERVYVARPGAEAVSRDEAPERVARNFSRRAAWDAIDKSAHTSADRDALAALWDRFGETLDF